MKTSYKKFRSLEEYVSTMNTLVYKALFDYINPYCNNNPKVLPEPEYFFQVWSKKNLDKVFTEVDRRFVWRAFLDAVFAWRKDQRNGAA